MISKFRLCSTRYFSSSEFYRLFSSSNKPPPDMPPDQVFDLLETSMTPENDLSLDDGRIAPEDSNILLFPGQGTQKVGMVKDLLKYDNVPTMFETASDILGYDLLKVCQQGPQEELNKTYICQPAIMLASLAGVEKIQSERPDILENCRAAAGFSVGEFAALVFSGALIFEDAVKLIKVRSLAMQRASDKQNSELVTCLGKSTTRFKYTCLKAREYCLAELNIENPVCNVTAHLGPNLVTIGGHTEAIDYIRGNSAQHNIRKIINVPVSGAFHTEFMKQAKFDLRSALKRITIEEPLIELFSNVTGKRYRSAIEIKSNLALQVVRPVLWEKIISHMTQLPKEAAMPAFYEVGPGSQLGTLLRLCNGKAFRNYCNIDSI